MLPMIYRYGQKEYIHCYTNINNTTHPNGELKCYGIHQEHFFIF